MTAEATRGFKVRALGEIAIRCSDMRAMVAFYRDIVGLEVLSGDHSEGIVFFKVADGFDGHTSVLALFRPDMGRPEIHPLSTDKPITGARSSLHHLALSLPFSEQEAVMHWYDKNNIEYQVQIFAWIGWRGIFTKDPEGNTVELVSSDPSLLQANPSNSKE